KQQKIQEAELSKIASTAGKSSDAFKRQQVRVNETATSINKTKSNMSALNDTIKKTNPSVFDRLKDKLHGTSNEAKDTSHNIMDIAKGSAIGNMVSNGFSNLGSALWSAAKNGFKLDEAGEELKKRWSDLGLPKREVKGLMDQIGKIRGASNASGSSINQLQRSLYNLTNGNVGHVKALTNELFAFGKQAGLSDKEIAGMGPKLTRVFSQSKVRLSAFNRAFGQMPGLRNAIIKASGMSKKAFNNALANGKISGTKLQELMIKASSKSGKAWERFGSTTKGQLAKAQGQYTNMTAMFMKPIEFVSIKALNGVMSQLVKKRGGLTKTGSAIQGIVKNLSKNIGKGITNTIDFIVHHIQGIKTFGEVLAGAFAAKKIYDFTGGIQKGIGEVAT
ncbi:tape measure protein, partial [Lactobacillus acetotolerans]|uniref:tape measure protein n=1 Tax=Lactobacillus acetotolerans TaxID=1600 RepID=UPI0024801965